LRGRAIMLRLVGRAWMLVKAPFNTNGCPRLYRRRQLCEHDRHAHDLLVTI
jgi:hypothetical protein